MSRVHSLTLIVVAAMVASSPAGAAELKAVSAGLGKSSILLDKARALRDQQLASATPQALNIGLGYVKGLSKSFTTVRGSLDVDLKSGVFQADVSGLDTTQTYSLWLVQQRAGVSVSNLSGARLYKLGDIAAPASDAVHIEGALDAIAVRGMTIDRVILAHGTQSPVELVASGSLSVLQKLQFQSFNNAEPGPMERLRRLPYAHLVPAIGGGSVAGPQPAVAAGTAVLRDATTMAPPLDVLIAQGETLFFQQQFNGNGRTCGTCHPATRNFTIDPAFIATLPATDALFVAEFNPALAQLEKPALMRQFGLILENVDGLDNPTQKFAMRSVPHTLGMTVSLTRDPANPAHPAQMTGWSGDGAPGAGALRDFAVGAVTQHFTKSLNRVEGPDFNLPNNQQLDAMEAFQLSLGRSADFDLTKITFLDANVASGQALFVNGTGDPAAGGRCSACHANGGARVATGENRNFNTNVEDLVNPARSVEAFPIDGGFGGAPANADGSFGNRTFNTPPVVEAADTAPFFHNNVVTTLEGVVGFYSGPVFNGPRAPGARFSFDAVQTTHLANFMRALNVLQNLQVARRELEELLALNGNPQPAVQSRLQTAVADAGDAIRVLTEGNIFPAVLAQTATAQQQIAQAQQTSNPNQRRTVVEQAVASLNAAQALLVSIAP